MPDRATGNRGAQTAVARRGSARGARRGRRAGGAYSRRGPSHGRSRGISIRAAHRGAEEVRAVPVREPNGEIRISAVATPTIVEAVRTGRDRMSVEFYALQEHRTAGGVREVLRALVEAAALTDDPEYQQTAAEVRNRRGRRVWL